LLCICGDGGIRKNDFLTQNLVARVGKMVLSILDVGIIGGGFIGIAGIFFPEFLYKYANFASEVPYDKKKHALKYRLGGLALVIMSIAFYIHSNFYR